MGAYYALECIVLSYPTFFLLEKGLGEGEIGTLIGVSCLIGGVLQSAAGRLSDTHKLWSWKNQLLAYSALSTLMMFILITVPDKRICAAAYAIAIVLGLEMMAMTNVACFYYSSKGIKINFGVARGIGSLMYAIISVTTGRLTSAFGYMATPKVGMALGIFLIIAVFVMPMIEETSPSDDLHEDKTAGSKGLKGLGEFIKKYPSFLMIVIGIALSFVLHNMVNTFLIRMVENVGGDSHDFGIALAIGALFEVPAMFLYSRLAKRFDADWLILISCGIYVIRGILYMQASSVLGLYGIQAMQFVTYAILIPAKASYAYEKVDNEYLGTGQALMATTDVFGMVAGSWLGGLLIAQGGINNMLRCGCILTAIGTLIILTQVRGKTRGKDKKDEAVV